MLPLKSGPAIRSSAAFVGALLMACQAFNVEVQPWDGRIRDAS